jgi:hypothetical protein
MEKDELIVKLEKLRNFYANRYNKLGKKNDRLRRRILNSLFYVVEERLAEGKI